MASNDHTDNDRTPSYPDSYNLPNILSIAAVSNKGSLASFSNCEAKTVLTALPGVSILSTLLDSTWDYLNGTSMAAPHATGVALPASETPSMVDGPRALKQVIMDIGKPTSATNGASFRPRPSRGSRGVRTRRDRRPSRASGNTPPQTPLSKIGATT